MPDANNKPYNPIYHAERCLYSRSITIYGAIGKRIYYRCTGKQAFQQYEEEWEQQEAMCSL